jgi:hypothetical protein
VGEEPNHTTARKPGPQYFLGAPSALLSRYTTCIFETKSVASIFSVEADGVKAAARCLLKRI